MVLVKLLLLRSGHAKLLLNVNRETERLSLVLLLSLPQQQMFFHLEFIGAVRTRVTHGSFTYQNIFEMSHENSRAYMRWYLNPNERTGKNISCNVFVLFVRSISY